MQAPPETYPSYLLLHASGELGRRAQTARGLYRQCCLCPRACEINRSDGDRGHCRARAGAVVASCNEHHGEEPPISGRRGSGTIFFSHCTLNCMYCQNYPISQLAHGREVTDENLAAMMIELQERGCHNVNFVTPTHFVPSILEALVIALDDGFRLPLVYNTSGYESVEMLNLLDGIFDIYMPDIKYASNEMARRYSGCTDYVEHNRAALKEMFRQVGLLQLDKCGVARRGMLVRHLVLPHDIAGTVESLRWMAENIHPQLHLSVMSQYFPAFRASETPMLERRVTPTEYKTVTDWLDSSEFQGWTQP